MRIAPVCLIIVACLGCAKPRQPEAEADSVERRVTLDMTPAYEEAIRKLVAQSDVILLGKITGVHDGRHRDAGMRYDVAIETVLYGEDVPEDTLWFRSAGWIGYAMYKMGEHVLLFAQRWQNELIQVTPVCYVDEEPPTRGLDLRPLEGYLDFIKAEVKRQKAW